jgi:hypothetical protein
MNMKKTILLLACMLVVSIAASAFNTSAVVLHHNGKMTTYDAEQINDAMEAAVDGDEVYLSEGTYSGFTIKKKINIRGAGAEMTIISGDVNINIPNTPVLTANLLEYIKVTGRVNVNEPLKGMRIKQCFLRYVDFKANTYDSYIDRCNIYEFLDISRTYDNSAFPYIKGLTITNSVIYWAHGIYESNLASSSTAQNTTFINCTLSYLRYNGGTIINSIINQFGGPGYENSFYNTVLINTYYKGFVYDNSFVFCEFKNCYNGNTPLDYTTADLASLGYYGNDGTIIGPLGGNTPYTLTPAVPHVTESSMKVDTEKKQLSVTLTVSPK